MALVFAGLTPHSPLLLEKLGKEKTKELSATLDAFEKLKHELYAAQCDTIIVISPHANEHDESFSVRASEVLKPNFTDFGDLTEYREFKSDLSFVAGLGVKKLHEEKMDYASAIPLLLLTQEEKTPKVVVIGTSEADLKDHFDFGYKLKDLILDSTKRIGLIISSDLAHTLNTDAPSGFSPFGEKFDTMIKERLADYNASALLQMDEEIINESQQCALNPILVFLGILQRVDYKYKELAYEHPFGVGYLTAQFIL